MPFVAVDPPRYRLEVSRGYVRLKREGHLPSRPRSSLRFAYRNGDWTLYRAGAARS